jgi:hypothetical protein
VAQLFSLGDIERFADKTVYNDSLMIRLMCAKIFCRALGMVVGWMALTAVAETNSIPKFTQLFIFPEPHLRAEFAKLSSSRIDLQQREANSGSSPTEISPAHLETQHSDSLILTGRGDRDVQRYYLRQRDFGFIPPAHVSNDPLTRACDSVFRPEEFHVGKTTVSCSILTAIKRKNPLCLINVNPYFLKVSW